MLDILKGYDMPVKTQQIPIGSKLTSTRTQQLSIKELSALYDRIYDIADRLIKKYSPCNIHTKTVPAKDLFFNPISPNKLITDTYCNSSYSRGQLCCGDCRYWDEGCTVKALGCKLFLCQCVKNKRLQKRFRKLREYGHKYLSFDYPGIDGYKWNYSIAIKYYHSKEDWLSYMKKKEV